MGAARRGRGPRPRPVPDIGRRQLRRKAKPLPLDTSRPAVETYAYTASAVIAVRNGGSPAIAVRQDAVLAEAMALPADAVARACAVVPRPRRRLVA